MICILGPNSQVGFPIVQQLSRSGHKLRVLAHSAGKVDQLKLPGVEVVVGDYEDAETMARLLDGVDQLFLQSPNEIRQLEVGNRIIDFAKRAGVKSVTKLSVFTAEENELCHFSRLHWVNDNYLLDSGMKSTILHPNTFMQSLGQLFGHEIRTAGTMSSSVGPDKTITMVDVRDVADVAAAVLARNEHKNETLLIMGPEQLSYAECARQIGERIGKAIRYEQISERDSITRLLRAGIPDWIMEGIKDLFRMYDRNDINPESDVTEKLTGRPARTFSDFLDDYDHLFR